MTTLSFRYTGPYTFIEHPLIENSYVFLFPGVTVSLPDNFAYVRRLIAYKALIPSSGGSSNPVNQVTDNGQPVTDNGQPVTDTP